MIWDIIKQIIAAGMVSWIGFLIISVYKGFKIKDKLSDWVQAFIKIKDYTKADNYIDAYNHAEDKLYIWNIILWTSIFVLLTFLIIFFR